MSTAHYDLAKGARGSYRYLLPMRNPGQKEKITNIHMLKSLEEVSTAPQSFHGMTGDTNEGRGSPHLYLVWTVESEEPARPLYISGFNVCFLLQ